MSALYVVRSRMAELAALWEAHVLGACTRWHNERMLVNACVLLGVQVSGCASVLLNFFAFVCAYPLCAHTCVCAFACMLAPCERVLVYACVPLHAFVCACVLAWL